MIYKLNNKRDTAIITAISLTVVCVFVAFHRSNGSINRASSQRSVSGHAALWNSGLVVFKNNWISGMGMGALSIPMQVETGIPNEVKPTIQIEPKNILLFFMDELGIAGLLLFIALLLSIIHTMKTYPENESMLGITAGWLALLTAGIFDTPFGPGDRYCGNLLIGVLIGSMILLIVSGKRDDPTMDMPLNELVMSK